MPDGRPSEQDRCLHELIEAQARRNAQAPAVVSQSGTLSYGELNARANRLARRLRALGVGPDARVGICFERGVEMIVSILGVLKAGGCYVPLDPAHPVDRLRWMLRDCDARVLIAQPSLRDRFEGSGVEILEPSAQAASREDHCNLGREETGVEPRHLAYVIYTSGSTGLPKGVMVEHRQVANLAAHCVLALRVTCADRILQFFSYGFDGSILEIFGALGHGAALVLVPPAMKVPDESFVAFLTAHGVTIGAFPTAFWHHWASLVGDDRPGLAPPRCMTRIVIGGEKAETVHVRRWLAFPGSSHCSIRNLYGPTETTAYVTTVEYASEQELPAGDLPIGRPVANTRIYVLDERGEPVPVGVSGELYVGGAQVARGYLNREELTAERFVADRFSEEPGARMYRTGDLGRWLSDGTIEYQGRNDGQVKIRGFRIELGEIEARLLTYPGVREAVVAVREGEGTKRLVAYYTRTAGTGSIEAMSLREHVQAGLPEYMVPAAYVGLERLPLTPNGKVDRRALPEPSAQSYAARKYEPPQGEVEETIARVWGEVLKVDTVGRNDNFFQLGGHSLLVVRVINRLRSRYPAITPMDLFQQQTVVAFAARIEQLRCVSDVERAVALRAGSDDSALFMIHDGAGDSMYAPTLAAALDLDMATYALPSPNDPREIPGDIPSIAARLLRMVRAVRPTGPYRLVGHCFGGVIAYEIARQLLESGETVLFLGLLDSAHRSIASLAPSSRSLDRIDVKGVLRQIEDHFGEHSTQMREARQLAASAGTWREMLERARKRDLLPPRYRDADLGEIERDIAVRNAYLKAWLDYRPAPIGLRVHLYVASEEHHPAPDLGWSDAIGGRHLAIERVGGDHFSMLQPPHVQALARELRGALVGGDDHRAAAGDSPGRA